MIDNGITPALWGAVYAARVAALGAVRRYEDAAAGYRLAVEENDTCYPVSQFDAAAVLGQAGAAAADAIAELDEMGDHDGFHAAYAGSTVLAALIGR